MSIVRSPRPDSNFATYSNAIIRDGRLSYKARGILLELLSRPDNWRVSAKSLAASGPDGRDSILAGLKELRDLGYIVTAKIQNEKGHFQTVSVVYDEPRTDNPDSDQPNTGFPKSDKPKSDNPDSLERLLIEEPIKKEIVDDVPSPEISEICFYLAKAIEKRGLKGRPNEPTINGRKWRSEARLLLRGRIGHKDTLEASGALTVAQIKGAIDYAMNDDFWATVIFSPAALRRDYPRLRAQAMAAKQKTPKGSLPASNNPVTQAPPHRPVSVRGETECQCGNAWPCEAA